MAIPCEFLAAPLKILPQHYLINAFGFLLLGLNQPLVNVTVYIFLNQFMKELLPNRDSTASDIAAGLFNLCFYISDIWMPVLGSYITTNYSFEFSAYFSSLLMMIISILFLIKFKDKIITDFNSFIIKIQKNNNSVNKEIILLNL